jgi:hypothetical protein
VKIIPTSVLQKSVLSFFILICGFFYLSQAKFNLDDNEPELTLNLSPIPEISSSVSNKKTPILALALVSGSCSSNAKEINKLQKLLKEEGNKNYEVVFLVMGELDYYIRTIMNDKKYMYFPSINDKDYSIYESNPFLSESDRVLLIKKADKSLLYKGNPLYNSNHFERLIYTLKNI